MREEKVRHFPPLHPQVPHRELYQHPYSELLPQHYLLPCSCLERLCWPHSGVSGLAGETAGRLGRPS